MPSRRITHLVSRIFAAAVVFAAACSKPDVTAPPTTGLLEITVQNSSGAPAAIQVTGPSGFSKAITATSTLADLVPGTYQVAAFTVSASGAIYVGAPSLQSVTVTASLTPVSVSITYAKQAPLALAIISSGPPAGRIGVDYGPFVYRYYSCSWSPVYGWHQVCVACASDSTCPGLRMHCGALGDTRACVVRRVAFLGFKFEGSGGTPSYSWSATGLPAGLIVDSVSGRVLGTPTTSGTFTVHVTLADSGTPQLETAADYLLVIAP